MRRTFVARALLTASVLAASACAVSPSRPRNPPHPSAAAGVDVASPWRAVPIAPQEHAPTNIARFALGSGALVIGESGDRWLFPRPPDASQAPPPARPGPAILDAIEARARSVDPSHGLVVVSRLGELFATRDPLGTLEPFGTLPAIADASALRFHRGSAVAIVQGQAFLLERSQSPRLLPTFEAQAIADLRMGADGRGVGLFLPETVALTTDFGATWRPIATPDLHVSSLGARGDEILLLPGGERDALPRSIDEITGALARALPLEDGLRPPRPARRHPGASRDSRTAPTLLPAVGLGPGPEEQGPLRFEPRQAFAGDRFAPAIGGGTSGDEVLTFFPRTDATEDGLALRTGIWRGRLGEGLRPLDRDTLTGCVVQASALCDDRTAVICGQELFVWAGARLLHRLPAPLDNATLAFDAAGAPLAVGHAHGGQDAQLQLARFDRDAQTASPLTPIEGLLPSAPRLTGGCHAPALWLSTTAARRWSDRLGGFEADATPLGAHRAIAIRFDGALVTSDGEALAFLPSGETAAIGPHELGHVAFAEDGRHALLSAPSGQAHQSDDGGATFSPIASPSVAQRQLVVCGRTRCQLGSGAFREGFARAAEPIPPWSEPPREGPRPVTDPPLPLVLTCTEDPQLFAGSASELIAPRLGATLYAGIVSDRRGRTESVWGDRDGREIRVELPRMPGLPRVPADFHFSFEGTGANAQLAYSPLGTTTTAIYRWEPRSAPRSLRTVELQPTFESHLLAEDGMAALDRAERELLLWGAREPERRGFSSLAGTIGPGILARDADDTWLVAEELDLQTVRLDRLPKDAGAARSRTLFWRGPEPLETGVGFVLEGGAKSVVTLEDMPGGGSELRLRSLSDDLVLGPPRPVPAARALPGRLLDLPTCAPDARGGLVRITTAKPLGVRTSQDTGVESAFVARLLRVTDRGACVERTYVTRRWGSTLASLVVAGNGGIAGQATTSGARCAPIAPLVAKPDESTSAAAPRRSP